MPKRHVFRPDVKAQILKRLKEDGVPVAQLAQEHGVSTKTIYRWLSGGITSSQPSMLAYAKLRKENQSLKELVGLLSLELQTEKKKTVRR
jgi:transposase-like protein